MSIPPIYPGGRLPAALVNNADFVVSKNFCAAPVQEYGEPIKKIDFGSEHSKQITAQAEQAIREGRVTDLTPLLRPQDGVSQDRYDPALAGKTIVNNAGLGIKVESMFTEDGQPILTSSTENKRAKLGVPTHGFFYDSADFLVDAAKKYAALGENEAFRFREIDDYDFVHDTLDFFTGGSYTEADAQSVQKQMTAVVEELAQQMKDGGAPDLSKLQSKLTIGGVDVSISQLLDFQAVGKELKDSFDGITVGPMNTTAYAKLGLAKAVSAAYGSGRGELGALFTTAMDRLYQKGVAMVQSTYSATAFASGNPWRAHEKAAVSTGLDIAEAFSKLDTSSKERLTAGFTDQLSAARSTVQRYCSQFGVPVSHVGLAGDTADISTYFNTWLERL